MNTTAMSIDDAEFERRIYRADDLSAVISSHKIIGSLLSELIDEALAEDHRIELDQLAFPLKVDLAIALGLIQDPLRAPLRKLNSIRNEFAHGDILSLDEATVRDFYNVHDSYLHSLAMGPREATLGDWHNLFRDLVAAIYVVLQKDLERTQERKLVDMAYHEEVMELRRRNPLPPDGKIQREQAERIAARVQRLKNERAKEP